MTTTTRYQKQNIHRLNGFRSITLTTAKGQDRKAFECAVVTNENRFFSTSRTEAANCIRYARMRG